MADTTLKKPTRPQPSFLHLFIHLFSLTIPQEFWYFSSTVSLILALRNAPQCKHFNLTPHKRNTFACAYFYCTLPEPTHPSPFFHLPLIILKLHLNITLAIAIQLIWSTSMQDPQNMRRRTKFAQELRWRELELNSHAEFLSDLRIFRIISHRGRRYYWSLNAKP